MSASRRLTETAPRPRSKVLCRSRIAPSALRTRQPSRSSAPMRSLWFASASGRLTIRASSTPSKSSMRCCALKLPQGPGLVSLQLAMATASTRTALPFDGTGIGRPWPLLAGERAHYELAAGRADFRRSLAGCDGKFHRRQPPDPRTGLGCSQIFRSVNCSRAKPRAPHVRWSGRTPSTSSSAARLPTERFSISLRRR